MWYPKSKCVTSYYMYVMYFLFIYIVKFALKIFIIWDLVGEGSLKVLSFGQSECVGTMVLMQGRYYSLVLNQLYKN